MRGQDDGHNDDDRQRIASLWEKQIKSYNIRKRIVNKTRTKTRGR